MAAYIFRRIILVIPTLLILSMLVFGIVRIIPGNVIDLMVTQDAVLQEMDRAAIEKALGIDQPIHVQYGRWLKDIITSGDLGKSLWRKTSVTEEIITRLPITFELGLMAIIIALVIAFPVGIWSAIRQDTMGDYIGRTFAIAGLAIPNFWIATLVMVFPALWWNWSPPVQYIRFGDDPGGNLAQFVIPAIIMGTSMSATTMRMIRTMMLEVMRQDYVRTAWAKGLKERVVITRHVLKNALIPVVTIIGFLIPVMVGGSVIMEQIFVLPGIGRLMVTATFDRDYPVIIGVAMFISVAILFVNLLVDVSYAYLDPRIQYR
ncbi:MAG TPA: ABC transporter permease [Dehalococcoidia bacterium]|nr:ABC transporter permease [Dehalococcoidia bacterium]